MFYRNFLFIILIFNLLILNSYSLASLYEELIVTTNLNYEDQKSSLVILKDINGNIFVKEDEISSLNIKDEYLTPESITLIDNKSYYSLNQITGLNYQYNPLKLLLTINVLPSMLKPQLQRVNKIHSGAYTSNNISPGMFMNYNLNFIYKINKTKTSDKKLLFYGLHEINYFNNIGVFSNSLIFRPKIKNFYTYKKNKLNKDGYEVIRLETNWIYENTNESVNYSIGDSFTKAAYWSGASRFFGVQYGTNFALRPDMITHPLLNINYNLALPGSIELYNSNKKIFGSEVRSGQLKLDHIPVITGSGEIEIKVRDITGQIQTIQIPYYIAPELLAKGIKSFSYAAGIQRRNYGLRNNKYRSTLLNFDYMYGISDYWTIGGHFESRDRFLTAGITNSVQIGKLGSVSYSLASNLDHIKKAQLMVVGYNYRGVNINMGFNIRKNWQNYYNIHDYEFMLLSDKPYYQFLIGYNDKDYGAISLSFITYASKYYKNSENQKKRYVINYFNQPQSKDIKYSHITNRLVALTYTKSILKSSILNCTVGKNLDGKKDSYVYLSLIHNLGNTNYYLSTTQRKKDKTYELSITSPMSKPLDSGYMARFMKYGKYSNVQLRLENSAKYMKSNIEWEQFFQNKNIRGGIAGSIVLFDNDLFFTRPINNSFAVVKTPNLPNVIIYNNNIITGQTNSKCKLIGAEVTPYIPVEFRINSKDIPFNIRADSVSMKTVTKKKTGTVVKFNTYKNQALEATLIDNNDKPLPVNSEVKIKQLKDKLLVGFDGKLYIDNISELTELLGSVTEDNKTCNFRILLEQNIKDPVIDVGKIICH